MVCKRMHTLRNCRNILAALEALCLYSTSTSIRTHIIPTVSWTFSEISFSSVFTGVSKTKIIQEWYMNIGIKSGSQSIHKHPQNKSNIFAHVDGKYKLFCTEGV